ncbi:MAG: hypothetical protein MR420_06205, partial [Spirochaetia bacterium]|nr:hypothetical protein [Spirochaetia bacterium]
ITYQNNNPILFLQTDNQEFYEIEEEHTTTIKFTSSQSTKVLEWVLAQSEIRGLAKAAGV